MSDPTADFDRDGNVVIRASIPVPEWATLIDSAFRRMTDFEHEDYKWHFTSLCDTSHSYGYICVMEKKGITHSMSGSAGLETAVAGFGATPSAAIDDAVAKARAYEASPEHLAYEEADRKANAE